MWIEIKTGKAHYFKHGRSLCGRHKHTLTKGVYDMPPNACAICAKIFRTYYRPIGKEAGE